MPRKNKEDRMKEFFAWLFSQNNSDLKIGLFDGWHFLYLFIVFGGTLVLSLLGRKFPHRKKKLQETMVYLTVGLYVIDFFIMPLSDSYGSISEDKLPFHICTVMCPVVAFVQFNKKCAKFREPVAILAIVAPLMYLTYPGAAVGELHALCYKVVQTFIYHGVLLAWGYLNLATGYVKPVFKRCYKVLIGLCLIACWAMIGNLTYGTGFDHDGDPHYDWFFLTGSTFDFIPKYIMPFAVIAAVFCVALMVYGIYYLVLHIQNCKKFIPIWQHVLFLLFLGYIWMGVWVYRTTALLNLEVEKKRNPIACTLLCLFVPFYIVYWAYASALAIDKMTAASNKKSNLAMVCLALAIFVPIVPPILMQIKINEFAEDKNEETATV